jgi:hypothetical protein
MKNNLKIFIFVLTLISPHLVLSESFSFNNNLYLGIDNPDVKVLQKLLNQTADTVVSTDGFGSKNNETTYFGIKTRDAVVKFQNKYRDRILTPNGLISGSGYVGPSTRSVLNELVRTTPASTTTAVQSPDSIIQALDKKKAQQLQEITSNVSTTNSELTTFLNNSAQSMSADMSKYFSTTTIREFNTKYATTDTNTDAKNYGPMYGWLNSASTTEFLKKFNLTPDYFMGNNWQKYPHIFSAYPTEASPGDKITISGINLNDQTLKLMLGSENVTYKTVGADTFEFNIPSSIPYGTHAISFMKNGSKYEVNQISILVKKKGVLAPYINSVKVESGVITPSINDIFIIKGDNFDDRNDITTSFGIIPNVTTSSKNEIRFSLADAPLLSGIVSSMRNGLTGFNTTSTNTQNTVPTVIHIKNSFGKSNTYGPINIKF